ncbi:MAG TPA: helix-turn-helix domain-containing protein [Solirubrobacteraceae bacterium]|nr:helix-turn-helix domain-containing protein [Solirubrobacteraceae bacterium]
MSETRPYTQVKRAQAAERTRTALLDAAEHVFLAGDWEEASLEAIAARAGTTKQTLLRHFGSKAGLLEAGAQRGLEQVGAQRLGAPRDDIDGAIGNLLDHYEDRGDEGLKLAAIGGDGALAEIADRARRLHYDWVDHAFGAWIGRAQQPARTRAAVIAICDVHTWHLLKRDLGLGRAEVHHTLTLMIRRLLEEDA